MKKKIISKKAENLLKNSNQLYLENSKLKKSLNDLLLFKDLVDSSSDAIFIITPKNSKLIDVNKQACLSLGYTREELLTMGVIDFETIAPDTPSWEAIVEEVRKQGSMVLEGFHKRKDGVTFPVEISAKYKTYNNNSYLIAIVRDISERRKSEKAIERFKVMFECSRDAVMTISPPSWKFTNGNPVMIKMFGARDESHFISKEPWKYSPQYQPDGKRSEDKAVEMIETAMKQGFHSFEWMHKKVNGENFLAMVQLTRLSLENENMLQATVRDITEQKNIEKALADSEKRFMDLQYSSDDAILLIDQQTLVDCNYSTVKMLKYTCKEEILMTHPSKLSPPVQPDGRESFEKAEEMMKIALINGYHRFEWMHRKADGEDFPVEVSLTPVTLKGKIVIHCLWRDITEHKKTEELLIRSQKVEKLSEQLRVFRMLSEASGQGIGMAKMDTSINYCNPTLLRLLEEPDIEHLKGKTFLSYYPKPEHQRLEKEILPTLMKRKQWTGEMNFLSRKGRIIPTIQNFFLVTDKDDKPLFVGDIITDISEQKKAEEELHKLSRAVEFSPVSVVITDIDGNIQYVNPNFTKVTGYSFDEVIGQNPKILQSGGMKADFYKELWDTIKSGNIWRGDFENKKKNGETYWESASISPIVGESGDILSFVAVKLDVTEKKCAEKELEKAKEIAESATKAKGDFLANMSHEIRTPMNAILGLNYLQRKTDLNHKQDEYARKIEYSAKNLLGIINDILDFSKIEAGKLDIEEIGFNLNDVLDNLSNMMIVKVQGKEIELIIAKDKDVPDYLLGDPLRLGQILINLSTNAIKFTDKGEVVVSVEKVKLNKKSATLKFSVSDTGIGLSEEQKNKLFQSFQQADTSTTRKYGGTGLGLSISKKLVELMHGNIGVDSVVGKGSTFYFTANFKVSERRKKERTGVIPEIIKNLNILVVDDSKTLLAMLSSYCKSLTFNVQTAENGEDALRILRNDCSISVVIMDWKMPGKDGLSVFREIKSDPNIKPKPKLILITAYEGDKVFTQAEELGIDGFLNKPVKESMILSAVADAFGVTITSEISTGKKKDKADALKSIRGASLLLVEDNEINQQVAVELLESEGLVVEVADNGKIAVDMISNNRGKYNLVLMDLQMPVMDGYTATETIRKNKDFDSLPIIAMTADAMSGVEEKVHKAGMNGYVTKPINVDELYRTLAKWIKPEEIKGIQKNKDQTSNVLKNDTSTEIELPKVSGINIKNGLKRVAGNKKLYKKILLQFAENNREFAGNVLKAVENKDQELAVRTAHTLKGVAGNIGATEVFKITKDLEGLLHGGITDLRAINKLLDKVNELLIPLIEDIDKFREKQAVGEKTEISDLDIEKVKQIVAELKSRLEEYSTDSSENFDKLKASLTGHGYEIQIMELEKHINAYDFENALEVLEKLAKKIL